MPGRHLIRDEPEPMDTGIPNEEDTPMEAKASSGTQAATGHAGKHGETSISPVNYVYRSPFPPTVTCSMRYKASISTTVTTGGAIGVQVDVSRFRLNSIYDTVLSGAAYTADPNPTADVADGAVNMPGFRSYWLSFYRYWTVVKSRYTLSYKHTIPPAVGNQLECYIYEHGQQYPPTTDTSGNNIIQSKYRSFHPGMKHHQFLDPPNTLALNGRWSQNDTTTPKHVYTGEWTPGSIHHEVEEDELAQTWHRATEVPPTPNICTAFIQASDWATTSASAATGAWFLDIEYIVQLKDLKAEHQYITGTSAIPAIASYGGQIT